MKDIKLMRRSPVTLATLDVTPGQRRYAAWTAAALVVLAAAALPFARMQGPDLAGFLPFIVSASIFTEFGAAYLISRQFRNSGQPALAVLAAGFFFTGLVLTVYMLTFPGTFSPGGLFGASEQTAPWMWITWHTGFPLFVIAYALLGVSRAPLSLRRVEQVTALAPAAVMIVVIAIIWGATRALGSVPMLVGGVRFGTASELPALVATACTVIALILMRVRRAKTSIAHLWLTVSLVAMLLDEIVTAVSGHRFSFGWYLARIDGLLASSAVFAALMEEAGRLSSILMDAEYQLQTVLNGVADAIVTINEHHVITSCNTAAALLFEIPRDRLVYSSISAVIPDFIAARPALAVAGRAEFHAQRSDGAIFPIEVAARETHGIDDASMILIARDITARKRAETALASARDQALETARLKAQFLATMSHEIRTPINAIVGMSELLLRTPLNEEQREYADTVSTSAEALLGVINDILDFSKLEAGKMDLDAVAFSPLAVVEGTADILASQARRKGLSLVTYVAPDVPKALAGDANRLKQVLLNLVSNAVKFTAEGSVVVRCTIERSGGDSQLLRFTVKDTGIGLSREAIGRLFMPFTQADGSTSRRFGGTGLGLSIAKRLVELMGGRIGADNNLDGAGTTFWFTARFAQISAEDIESVETPPTIAGSCALIVDDDKSSREILMQYLMSWGIAVDVAADAAHAMELLKSSRANQVEYDFAIIDYLMPDLDGIDLGKKIRKLDDYHDLPMILVTAFDESGRGGDAVDAGFAGYLRKPMKQSSLYDAIAFATERKTSLSAPRSLAPFTPVAGAKNRVLLAEDHEVNQKLAIKQLQKLGYDAVAVADGQEAIDRIAREHFDVVLMDCQMPVVDGFEATRLIRRRETQTGAHIPIIAMTANAMEGDRETCLAAGMDDYIAKPVQMEILRSTLARWTNDRAVSH